MHPTAIIGAGIAGLACAQRLREAGRNVVVFDKGRGVGGRMATRRVETSAGPAQFDHGAQFFTARDGDFAAAIHALGDAVAPWPDALVTLEAQRMQAQAQEPRFVGAPGMNAIPKALARGLDVRLSSRVADLHRDADSWRLTLDSGDDQGRFDAVLIATPAEQAAPLLAPHDANMAHEALAAKTAPCWAGLFAFDRAPGFPVDALRLADHPVLAWMALDSSKAGRNGDIVCWVAHARADWSAANLERAPEEIAPILQDTLMAFFDSPPAPIYAQAHRWRFAQVQQAAPTPCAWNADLKLGACGDWRLGPRVECAWMSGRALAEAVLRDV